MKPLFAAVNDCRFADELVSLPSSSGRFLHWPEDIQTSRLRTL